MLNNFFIQKKLVTPACPESYANLSFFEALALILLKVRRFAYFLDNNFRDSGQAGMTKEGKHFVNLPKGFTMFSLFDYLNF